MWGIRFFRLARPLALALLLVVAQHRAGSAADAEPYPDVAGHWAQAAIEALRQEGTTDGYPVTVRRPYGLVRLTYFRPNRDILVDEWVVLGAKVFDLPVPDVQGSHRLDGGQQVYRWLAAADQAGWPYGRLKDPVPRIDAVDLLVEALGLTPYAQSLPRKRVDEILSVYKDEHRLGGRKRRQVAAATLLGIVEGYPDRTFRPDRRMTRAEGATILARSALARADAAPNPFYPDGDGYEDETWFSLTGLRNRNLSRWRLTVMTAGGSTAWSTGAARSSGVELPARVAWDGVRANGRPASPGEYFYQLSIWDLRGQQFDSARKPLIVGRRHLEGGLTPERAAPGTDLSVWADTWGDAEQVTVTLVDGGVPIPLTPGSSSAVPRRWTTLLPLPDDIPPGTHAAILRADFGPVHRSVTLTFTVQDSLTLDGWLEPTALAAGDVLTVWASTVGSVDAVTATFSDGTELNLEARGGGRWRAEYTVPPGTPVGSDRVIISARGPAGLRQVERWFEVTGDLRQRVQTILAD